MPWSDPLRQFGAVKICHVVSDRISVMMTEGIRELNLNSLCIQQFEFAQVDDLFHYAKFIRDLFQRNKPAAKSVLVELKLTVGIKKPQLAGLFRFNRFYSIMNGLTH